MKKNDFAGSDIQWYFFIFFNCSLEKMVIYC